MFSPCFKPSSTPSRYSLVILCEITGQTSVTTVVCVCVCSWHLRGRSHRCVSWPCCTSETPSPLTWSWRRLCPDREPASLPPSSRCFWCYRYTDHVKDPAILSWAAPRDYNIVTSGRVICDDFSSCVILSETLIIGLVRLNYNDCN